MSFHAAAETIESQGCTVVLRRVEGPLARELYLSCQPPAELADAGRQCEAVYRAILSVLEAEGGSFASVVSETLFLRSVAADLDAVRATREGVLATGEATSHRPATSEIEQPPLRERACLEVALQAVLPSGSPLQTERVEGTPSCACNECARSTGLRVRVGGGDEVRFHTSAVPGGGAGAYEQTLAMFEAAEALLQQAGMAFGDVVRTWIHLREMDRDYAELNRARRGFFEARGIDPPPASTGIGGGPVPAEHDLSLSLYAVKSASPIERTVMTTPTLNEAMVYGSDFVRGMRVAEANKTSLFVSGTASIDEAGETVHTDDFDAQADRMLLNIAALLEGQGASFRDVVSAITYVKRPADAERLLAKFREARFEGFPNVLVEAAICRPELLCEVEALAVVPSGATAVSG